MKRDLDLIRSILLLAETTPADARARIMRIQPYDDAVVAKHIELLQDAGFVEADLLTTETQGAVSGRVRRITWEGYEFLEAARSESLWNKAKEQLGSKLGAVPIEVVKQLLTRLAAASLGL